MDITQYVNVKKKIGASGKSTIFKNLRKSKGDVICDLSTIEETANAVRSNLVQYMVKMLIKSQQIYDMDKEANKGCLIPDEPKTLDYARIVLKYGQHNFADDTLAANTDIEELGTAIDYLWKVSAIQETFKRRGLLYSFPDNLEFFYDKCLTVMSTKYAPTEEDVIKARVRTTGKVLRNLFL
ncbi:guanine nucleotide-binding protein alpha-1 subunit [Reticulomyxa filosa]|uniref:Guanine nucleotide-binding protein alpha-1 subunit n=1 Tax=Reticulomyxa filosa TaxID=46433 RepID=X6NEH8_RETFI|nr:guanine nucleotide-binding protein alpha-1 subunit [Reticulomyxa filosa]|eukprot:ETO24164.1 guanine nucleotide-binding protein alpha-1 subunit [Reticulomyxa filosa]